MGNKTTMGSNFAPEIVSDIFNKVKGHSSLIKLAGTIPVKFAGTDVFTFSLDSEVSIVGEGGQKPAGNATVAPVSIKPIKVVYQHRVTDEFLRASAENALPILAAFNEGFAKKIATGLDIMAMHGLNPATLEASTAIGTNHLDNASITEVELEDNYNPEVAINTAIAALGEYEPTGYAFSKPFAAALGSLKENGVSQYPEFKLGGNPGRLVGVPADVNSTVNKGNADDYAFVGDFANAFRWGFAENMPMKVIEYGDPDGLGDLQRTNEVVLRAEAYIGWGILDNAAFVRIVAADEPEPGPDDDDNGGDVGGGGDNGGEGGGGGDPEDGEEN